MEMNPSQIKTSSDFDRYIRLLTDETPAEISLEEYLRALWGLIQEAQAKPVTYALLGQLLHDAFLADPLPFDESWLQFKDPPDLDGEEQVDSFSLLQQMILYQIADLHRMAQSGQLEGELIYFGITSPTGHSWYNFDPATYLKCAMAAEEDAAASKGELESIEENNESIESDWSYLAFLLYLGQIYE